MSFQLQTSLISTLLPHYKWKFVFKIISKCEGGKKKGGNTVQMECLIFLFTLFKWGNQGGLKVQMKLLQHETPWESGRKFWQIQVLYVWELHCCIYLPFHALLGNFLRCLNPSHRGEITSLKQFSVGKLFVLLWLKWLDCRPCSVFLPLAWSMSSYSLFLSSFFSTVMLITTSIKNAPVLG